MSIKHEILQWQNAVDLFRKGQFSDCIKKFLQISDAGARIYFNMGMIYAGIGRFADAVISFVNATHLDNFLAVGFFQRGVSYWSMEDYANACDSFTEALKRMRDNAEIDYQQLGLNYQLYLFEILVNRGLCFLMLNQPEQAMEDFKVAQQWKVIEEHESNHYSPPAIQSAIDKNKLMEDYSPFCVPFDLIFEPPEYKVKNSEKVDYLGVSKVIASIDEKDESVIFSEKKSINLNADKQKEQPSKNAVPSSKINASDLTISISDGPRPPPKVLPRQRKLSQIQKQKKKTELPAKVDLSCLKIGPSEAPSPLPKDSQQKEADQYANEHQQQNSPKTPKNIQKNLASPRNRLSPLPDQESVSSRFNSSPFGNFQTEGDSFFSPKTTQMRSPFLGRCSRSSSVGSHLSTSTLVLPPGKFKVRVTDKGNNEIRAFLMDERDLMSFDRLLERVGKKFGLDQSSVSIRYRDEDDEPIAILDDDDLNLAMISCSSNCKLEIEMLRK